MKPIIIRDYLLILLFLVITLFLIALGCLENSLYFIGVIISLRILYIEKDGFIIDVNKNEISQSKGLYRKIFKLSEVNGIRSWNESSIEKGEIKYKYWINITSTYWGIEQQFNQMTDRDRVYNLIARINNLG